MGPECDEEAGVAVQAEQHPQVIVDAKRPVVAKVTFELVCSKQGILRISGEAPEDRPEKLVPRGFQLARPPEEPGGRGDSHAQVSWSAAKVDQERIHVRVGRCVTRCILGFRFPDLAQEERTTRRSKLLALGLIPRGIDDVGGCLRTLQDRDGLVSVPESFEDLRRPLPKLGHTNTFHSTLDRSVDGPVRQPRPRREWRSVLPYGDP